MLASAFGMPAFVVYPTVILPTMGHAASVNKARRMATTSSIAPLSLMTLTPIFSNYARLSPKKPTVMTVTFDPCQPFMPSNGLAKPSPFLSEF